jgi:hypothetical protein
MLRAVINQLMVEAWLNRQGKKSIQVPQRLNSSLKTLGVGVSIGHGFPALP